MKHTIRVRTIRAVLYKQQRNTDAEKEREDVLIFPAPPVILKIGPCNGVKIRLPMHTN